MRMQVILGRFPFSQKFRKFRFGAKWKTFFRFARQENSQKKQVVPVVPLFLGIFRSGEPKKRFPFSPEPEFSEFLTKWKAPLDSSFARPGSAPMWRGKKGEFRDWTTKCSLAKCSRALCVFLLTGYKDRKLQAASASICVIFFFI